jgi:hypothetical protein
MWFWRTNLQVRPELRVSRGQNEPGWEDPSGADPRWHPIDWVEPSPVGISHIAFDRCVMHKYFESAGFEEVVMQQIFPR